MSTNVKVDASLLGSESYSNGPTVIEDPRTGSNYYYESAWSRLLAWWTSWWLTEILGVVLSLAFQAGTIGILVRMQNKPLTSWTISLSLNTVVAVGTTLAKIFMLSAVAACQWEWKWIHFRRQHRRLRDMDTFDWASRGPLGSLMFILRFPIHVATIGAVVAVVAVAVDSFAQQVVYYDTVDLTVRNDSAGAFLNYNHNYSTGSHEDDGFTPYKDRPMLGAIYQGVYQTGKDATIGCSGNCIFNETYTSLGFSSTCTNVTEATWSTKNCTSVVENGSVQCTYKTPGGVPLYTEVIPTMQQTIVGVNATDQFNASAPGVYTNFTRMAILRSPDYDGNSTNLDLISQEVVECNIGLTAYQYTNFTAVGTSVTGTTKTLGLYFTGTDPYRPWGSNFDFNEINYPMNFSTTDPSAPELSAFTNDLATIVVFMKSPAFSGQVTNGDENSPNPEGVAPAFLPKRNNLTIPQIVESMTDSMTAYVRGGPGSSSAVGYVVAPVVFVRVNWVWLSLPLVAEGLTVLLVLMTMAWSITTRRPGAARWRSSNVALLYHFVDQPGGILKTEVTSVPELHYFARSTMAKLE